MDRWVEEAVLVEARLELGMLEMLMSKRSSDLARMLCIVGREDMAAFCAG
jgi:hypothetical protein